AGEFADVALDGLRTEAETREDLPRARFEAVAVELVETRLHVAEPLHEPIHVVGALRIGEGMLELVQLVGDGRHLARPGDRLLEEASSTHLADVLREIADGRAALDEDAAGVRLLLADDQAEDRRLSGPVRTDEPHLLTAEHRHRGVEEEDAAGVLLADGLETDHARRGSSARKPTAAGVVKDRKNRCAVPSRRRISCRA